MPVDFREIRKTVISSIKYAVGGDLSQAFDPETESESGMVLRARPNPEKSIPSYPYAVLDILSTRDTDWPLTNFFSNEEGIFQYETHKTIEMQVSIFGGDAISIADKLKTAYRRQDVRDILIEGGIALAQIGSVQILPQLLQTDWLEAAFLLITIRVNDVQTDPSLTSIDNIVMEGELCQTVSGIPLSITIDTTIDDIT